MVQAMDHEAVEGAMNGASDARSDRWYKRWIRMLSKEIWIRKLSKERWMVEFDLSNLSFIILPFLSSDARSDRWYKRWITKRSMIQAMDHEAFEGDMDQEAVEGCKRWKER